MKGEEKKIKKIKGGEKPSTKLERYTFESVRLWRKRKTSKGNRTKKNLQIKSRQN